MKRMHIHIGVGNLEQSIKFYSTLFGAEPVKSKADYAKWMLEDPRINFAISTKVGPGVDHLGLQVDSSEELQIVRERLKDASVPFLAEGETTCCYAYSDKLWTRDPSGIAWETYNTMADVEVFRGGAAEAQSDDMCCTPETKGQPGCCVPSKKTVGCCD